MERESWIIKFLASLLRPPLVLGIILDLYTLLFVEMSTRSLSGGVKVAGP
jgi:hypothetical protein